MPSERVQRQIDQHLDAAEAASLRLDWPVVIEHSQAVLALDSENADAPVLLKAALSRSTSLPTASEENPPPAPAIASPPSQPTSFANGRYAVTRFLGEGGKKKVYLARDSLLDRDVALALIKTEGLDEAARQRVSREAQAMGRLGAHPNIVTVFDIGEENAQPFLILPVMSGGDVEGVIEEAPEHRLTLDRAIEIASDTCKGLEFSHSKGIIHRDLKPGNVWLTEDGRAMIGDFGLAVAVDKSRLTQAGMMVGTVNYMPPEQAMGGEVGPRSDLYSLGAMLYEMVCGRPPFVGDESVAIIGQHLNTPPVAPSWHRPDCPPALEALILRLLEKDPSKRPASATEVREALESVTVGAPLAGARNAPSVTDTTPSTDNPLYRRTFVGRETELRRVQAAFDAALSGQGGLVMVVGEPGIGKTALCEQLATYVALRGGKALVGHCYEEGSLSLPYLAFVEAMRSYVLAREPDGLRSDLGTGAADVARIVSEVRDRVQGVELRPAGDPEDDRWRLLQAVTSFLRNASTVQALCIVLEDLHWADRGTLDLLLHASRNLQGARLLIIGTYRDVEVDRSHPLSNALADLRRASNFARVPLRGLTVDEVHRMYEAVRGQETPWAHAEAVFRATEGNPLFVQEVLRYLVEEGIVVREDGRYVAPEGVGASIPEGLRDVVGKRLSRLGEKTNQALAIAAVMGRDFRLDVLQIVANLPEEELYTALAEAVERAVIEERSGLGAAVAYRFAHAFFRTTLYEETIAPRRIRLHQQVARALEAVYGRRLEEHAAELAEHYSYSSSPDDLKKAVEYGELAAARATSVFDYGEAERHLEQALKVQEVLDPDDRLRRCDLLLALGDAMLPQENPRRVLELVADEAFSIAESIHDSRRAVRAAVQACEVVRRAYDNIGVPILRDWAQKADQFAEAGTKERVYADIYVGLSTINLSREQGHAYLRTAMERARALQDPTVFFAAAGWAMNNLLALSDRDLVLSVAAETINGDRTGARSRDLAVCLWTSGVVLLEHGERGAAETAWKDLAVLAEQTRDVGDTIQGLGGPIVLAILDGHLEEALGLIDARMDKIRGVAVRGIGGGLLGVSSLLHARLLYYLGKPFDGPLAAAGGPGRVAQSVRSVMLSFLGRHKEVQEIRNGFSGIERDDDQSAAPLLLALLETAVLSSDKETASALARRLAVRTETLSMSSGVSIGRICGEAAALLSKPEEAKQYFGQGLEASQKIGFRPEIALIRLDLAELLLEHYPDEHDAAIEHLDFAIAELRDMKMQPALERALRHRGLLKA